MNPAEIKLECLRVAARLIELKGSDAKPAETLTLAMQFYGWIVVAGVCAKDAA